MGFRDKDANVRIKVVRMREEWPYNVREALMNRELPAILCENVYLVKPSCVEAMLYKHHEDVVQRWFSKRGFFEGEGKYFCFPEEHVEVVSEAQPASGPV